MLIRIGALSQQTGVSAEVLRSWERRYGLLQPERTAGGFRLYSEADVRRIRMVTELMASGASAGDAARQVLAVDSSEGVPPVPLEVPPADECRATLAQAFRSLNEASIEAAVDLVFARLSLDSAIRDVFLPCLREVGDDWAEGRTSIGQEHVAMNAFRGRLMGLSRGWDRGAGPRVLLACPPGEYHDIPLAMFGLALHQRGWRVTFLGADTPLETLVEVSEALKPRLRVLFSVLWGERMGLADSLALLSSPPTAVAGSTGEEIAKRAGLRWLPRDPVTEAEAVTREFVSP
ncbi:MAG: MerR family transcriptional regulator [Anaerolineaceae bacterium]